MRVAITVVACSLLLALAATAPGQDYVVDQSCVGDPSTSNDLLGFAPMGQQFVPGFDRVDVIELVIRQYDSQANIPTLAVHVRSDSMTGPILGTTEPVTPPSGHSGPLMFEFAESVPLIPGNLYVMELVPLQWGYGWYLTHTHADYPHGHSFIWGNPSPNMDLWFREGAYDWVPVQAMTWGSIKALMSAGPSN